MSHYIVSKNQVTSIDVLTAECILVAFASFCSIMLHSAQHVASCAALGCLDVCIEGNCAAGCA